MYRVGGAIHVVHPCDLPSKAGKLLLPANFLSYEGFKTVEKFVYIVSITAFVCFENYYPAASWRT